MSLVQTPVVAYGTLELNQNGSISDGLIENSENEYIILAAWFRMVARRVGTAPIHKCKLSVNDEDITIDQTVKTFGSDAGDMYMWPLYPEIWHIPEREDPLHTQGARLVPGDDLSATFTISNSTGDTGKVEVWVLLLPTGN